MNSDSLERLQRMAEGLEEVHVRLARARQELLQQRTYLAWKEMIELSRLLNLHQSEFADVLISLTQE